MSLDAKKSDDFDKRTRKFLPLVHTREGELNFNPRFIYESLVKETNISKVNAQKVTENVTRFLIAAHLEFITAPLIREVVNTHLLKMGLEQERLQYTRIGLPFFDLDEIFTNTDRSKEIVSKIMGLGYLGISCRKKADKIKRIALK